MTELSWDYDDETTIFGTLVESDASYSDEFGTVRRKDYDIENLHFLVKVGGNWEEIKLLHEGSEERFKRQFLDWALSYKGAM